MTLGFIGLGQLGSRLARRLLESGYTVAVYDRNRSAAEELTHLGATGYDIASELANHCNVAITCLPSPDASRDVMIGSGRVLENLSPGSTWIEASTVSVQDIREMSAVASAKGIGVLEAPFTGGVHRAAGGKMTVLAGGDEKLFEEHRQLLESLASQVIYLGEIGNASLVKVISNLLCLVDLVAAGEALMLASKGGIDLAQCYRAICASSGTSREFEDWVPVILNGSLNTGFTTDLGLKDLGFVTDLGEQHGVPLKLAGLVKELFEQSRELYGGDAWTPHVVRMLEEEAGEELRAEGFDEVIN